MKIEWVMFAILGVFFTIVGVVYGLVTGWGEPVGAVALLLCAGLGFMIAFYLWLTARHLPARPDDNPDGEIADIAGSYGTFAPYSWWPLWLGLTAALCFLGVAVGWWVFAFGAVTGFFATIGWTFEFYKGEHAH